MKVRELVEFFVFPKSFKVLSFHSQGNYALRMKLTLQNKRNEECFFGFPVLVESDQARKDEEKKASVSCSDSYYQTQQFFITVSQQRVILNTGCIFKTEYSVGETYQTFLDFELLKITYKKNGPNQGDPTSKIVKTVDKRRLHINAFNSANRFKRVLFDDCHYFSYSEVLIMSESFGSKIRLHDYYLSQFFKNHLDTLQSHHNQELQSWINENKLEHSRKIKQAFGFSVEQFYSKMILQKVLKYRKLCQTYQNFRYFMTTNKNALPEQTTPQFDDLRWIKAEKPRSKQAILDIYGPEETDEVFMAIYLESQSINHNIMFVWQNLFELLIVINSHLFEQLACKQFQEQQKIKDKWLLSYSQISDDLYKQKMFQFLFKRNGILTHSDIYQDSDLHHPLLIIENFLPSEGESPESAEISSLVVMVHGYQGNRYDLLKARNFLKIYNPQCHVLLIKTIEQDQDNSIERLGQAVAQQVRLHINNSSNNYRKISFVGHSLGGIIARESFKHLESFKELMHIFISFAAPHVGIRDNSNALVQTGIWFLTNFGKNISLKQLNCQPNEDSQVIALEKLSECKSIGWFKKFILVSSKDDHYVPYESSCLENNLGDLARKMCFNIRQNIKRLQRVDVWFDVNHLPGALDKMIGRKAHTQFLQNRMFLNEFFSVYGPLL